MASMMNIFLLTIFLCVMISKVAAQGQCDFNDLKISQVQTGATVQNKPEWKVTVKNDCVCTQFNIQLSCSGFQTVEAIDPSILSIGTNSCALVKDSRIFGSQDVSFNYAWDTQFPFAPTSSDIACS